MLGKEGMMKLNGEPRRTAREMGIFEGKGAGA